MSRRPLAIAAFVAAAAWSSAAWGQQEPTAEEPLSAIDWLATVPREEPVALPQLFLEEPSVTSAAAPSVETAPLSGGSSVGLLTAAMSGFPETLWEGARAADIEAAFEALPAEAMAPVRSLRKRLLLAAAAPPIGADSDAFLVARLRALRELGAVTEALKLIDESYGRSEPFGAALFSEYADLTLLAGTEEAACRRLLGDLAVSQDVALRIFCLARGGDWNAAALTLSTSQALGDLNPNLGELLAQFLEPELVDAGPLGLPEGPVTPLTFRLREAVGYPLASADLPRSFAVSDLRSEMGWKAQIDAAERLARTGAMEPNQLFALYTARVPAASGGVWDRAEAMQRLESAIEGGRERAIERTFRIAVRALSEVGLETELGAMLAGKLPTELSSSGPVARALLMSASYESVPEGAADPLSLGLALGDVSDLSGVTALERALIAGFSGSAGPPNEATLSLGLGILEKLAVLEQARNGQYAGLADALSGLRMVGLEDTARRAALELWLAR